jgi:phosphoadenylyl-sulfate reductase (thioredoxin)
MVAAHGPNLFYHDAPLRMLCCHVRKVRPLERKLATLRAWVAGLRRSQTAERAAIRKVDSGGNPVKICPLADWTAEQVDRYILKHDVPVHPLYGRGYASIGCAPCTRALADGEDERAGRWWWEQQTGKECGIHFSPDGKAARRLDVLVGEVLAARHA